MIFTMIKHGKNHLFALAMMTTLFVLALILPVAAQTDFDCSAVTEIPAAECTALVGLYNNGDGDNWSGNWLESNTPCSWTGITCESGRVVSLTPPADLARTTLYVPAEIIDLTHLRRLNLSNVPIELPLTIGQMSRLTHLTLQGTELNSLPDEIGNLSNLAMIRLDYNSFSMFPTVLTTLPALRELYFSYNGLTEIPAEIGNISTLRRLNLGGNGLTTVPAEISNLGDLRSLLVRDNELISIPVTFDNMPDLEEVDFAGNALTVLPDSIAELLDNPAVDVNVDDNPWEFSCELIPIVSRSSIPVTECEALVALYNNLDGESWRNEYGSDSSDWLQSLYICWWDYVECNYDRTHIIRLDLPQEAKGATIPAEIGNLTELTTLELDRREITSLPDEIGNLTKLRTFDVSENALTTLPAGIGGLTNLLVLDVSENALTILPAEIGSLSSLKRLTSINTQLTTLPPEIGNLTNLKKLRLQGNQLTEFPATIGNLTNLTELSLGGVLDYSYLADGLHFEYNDYASYYDCDWYGYGCDRPTSGNQLTTLPPEIGNLSNLNWLGLEYNQLTTLPAEIGNLTQLRGLYVAHNQLTELPAELGNLPALNRLTANHNQLTAIPAEIGNITTLSDLFLNDNQLTTVIADFSNMNTLQTLHLQNNQLTAVPTALDSLPDTVWVDFGGNQLVTTFDCATVVQILQVECEALVALFNSSDGYSWIVENPYDSIYNSYGRSGDLWFTTTTPCSWSGVTCTAARITTLNVSGYGLSGALPAEIGTLTELTELVVSANELTEIPAEIGNLTKLDHLNISQNQFTSLPSEIGSITSLTRFGMSDNQLTEIPAEIGNLINLESVWFSNNNLTALPDTMGNLINVQYLNLSNNQLTTLPDGIGNLIYLDHLFLSYNPITSWPNTLTNLQNLSELYVYGLCGPDDLDVNVWIEQYTKGLTRCSDVSVAGQLWIEQDGINGFGITDQPIVSATVQMQKVGGQLITVTTDATGQYNFTTLPLEDYTLSVDTTTFTATATLLSEPDDVLDNATTIHLNPSNTTAVHQNFSYFSCAAVTEIPAEECDALLAIYNENGGRSWTAEAQSGWIENSTPCSWANVICEDGHVKELRFFSAGLVGDMSPAVGAFSELTHLGLWDNRLLSLPAELVDLTNLERLDIGRNPWPTFPAHVTDVTSLLGLYVADANLTALPDDINNLTALEDLHLWENRLIELPVGIGDLVNMERLILRNNLLQNLPLGVSNLTNLIRLDVKYNNLATLPTQLETIASLNEIDIQGNSIPCSQVSDWTSIQGACADTSDIPLAVDTGGMETGTSSMADVLLFLPFVMAAVTKQTLAQ